MVLGTSPTAVAVLGAIIPSGQDTLRPFEGLQPLDVVLREFVVLESLGWDGRLVVTVFFVVGLLIVYDGFGRWQRMRLIQDTPTEQVRSAAAGRTELTGTARAIESEGPLPQPFTDGECLVATYEVEAEDDDGWETVDTGVVGTPFHLDDGTGRMRVEPETDATYEISDANRSRIRVDAGAEPPGGIADCVHIEEDGAVESGLRDLSTLGTGDHRYTQNVIPPGTDVYLLGGAEPTDAETASTPLVLGPDSSSGEFIIADQTEAALVSEYRWLAPAEMVGGLLLSAATLYLLLG